MLYCKLYCKISESTYFEEHLQTAVSENVFLKLRKSIKNADHDFNSSLKKQEFSTTISETSENVCLFFDWFPLEFLFTYNIFFDCVSQSELIKRRSRVQEKNMSYERAFDFYQ